MTDPAIDPLTASLRRLAEPAPPESLEATVMARIARLPEPVPDAAIAPVRRRREMRAWALTMAGLMVALGPVAFQFLVTFMKVTPAVWALRGRSIDLPAASPFASAPLVVGLLLFGAGLFALAGMRRPATGARELAR